MQGEGREERRIRSAHDEPPLNSFQSLRSQYFDTLCHELLLTPQALQSDGGFCRISADSGNVRIYFQYDRGLFSFQIGAIAEAKPLCSIEELAERFPRVRLLSEGARRLSLEEQSSFIKKHWSDLQVTFSPQHLPETRRWNAARAAAVTAKYSA